MGSQRYCTVNKIIIVVLFYIIYVCLGLVTNERGEPVLDADVVVKGINHNITTSNKGEYWRLLLPGRYEMFATAFG